ALRGGIDRQLDGRAHGLLAGEDRAHLVVEERVVRAVQQGVLRPLEAAGPGDDGEEAGEARVLIRWQTLPAVGPLELVRRVRGHGVGDGSAVDEDRAALAGDLVDERAVVEGILVERLRAEELDVAGRGEQQREHHEAHDCDVAECPVHARPPSSVGTVGSVRTARCASVGASYGETAPVPWPVAGVPVGLAPVRAGAVRELVESSSSTAYVGRTPVANSSCGRRALSLMRRSRPMMIQLATSELPPAARNGVVRPVSGMRRVTPPMTMKHW